VLQVHGALGLTRAEPGIVEAGHKARPREDSGVNAEESFCVEPEAPSQSYLVLLSIGGNDAEPVFDKNVLDSYRCCF
jgi:hypothetical protein